MSLTITPTYEQIQVVQNQNNVIQVSAQGPVGPGVPTGGVVGQYLRKQSAADYDATWANIVIGEVTGLSAALAALQPLNASLTQISGLTFAANDLIQYVGGVLTNRTPTQVKASLAIATGDVSGLGTIATQNANAVAITGGTINGATVGATTPASGAFTTISSSGNAVFGTAGANTARANINAAASGVGLIVRANATTPGNLQEWQDSAGVVQASISAPDASNGVALNLYDPGSTTTPAIKFGITGGDVSYFSVSSNANAARFFAGLNGGASSIFGFSSSQVYVLLAASSFANAATGTGVAVYKVFGSTGNTVVGSANAFAVTDPASDFTVIGGNASKIVTKIRGASSQTANLQEWQDSSANVLAYVTAAGHIGIPIDGGFYWGAEATNNSWRIIPSGANLVIQKRELGSWVTKSTITA